MKKTLKKLSVLFASIVILSSLSFADYTQELEDTVIKQEKQIEAVTKAYNEYKNTAIRNIDRCQNEKKQKDIEIKDLKRQRDEKVQWLVKVPFTNIGITVPFAQGFIAGAVVTVILL